MKVARKVRLPEAEFGTPNLGVQVLWLSAVSCEGKTEGRKEFSNRRPQRSQRIDTSNLPLPIAIRFGLKGSRLL